MFPTPFYEELIHNLFTVADRENMVQYAGMNWARTARIGSRILRIAKPVINTLFPESRIANPLIDMAALALQRAGRPQTTGV